MASLYAAVDDNVAILFLLTFLGGGDDTTSKPKKATKNIVRVIILKHKHFRKLKIKFNLLF